MKLLVLLIFLHLTFFVQGQSKIDSVSFYRGLGYEQVVAGKYLTGIKSYQRAISHAEPIDSSNRSIVYYMISTTFLEANAFDSAKYYLQKANQTLPQKASAYLKCKQHRITASNYYANGELNLAMTNCLKALDYAKKSKNVEQRIDCVLGIGQIFLLQKDYNKAKEYFQNALEIAKKENRPKSEIDIKLSLASVFLEEKEYDLAERSFKECAAFYEESGNKKGLLMALSYLIKVYFNSNRSADAIQLSPEVMKLLKEFEYTNNTKRMVSNSQEINSATNENAQELESALAKTKDNIETSQAFNPNIAIEQEQAYVKTLEAGLKDSSLDTSVINPTFLIDEMKKMQFLQDSIYKSNLNNKIHEIETRHGTKEAKSKNIYLLEKNKKERTVKWGFVLASIIVGLISVLLFFLYRRNKKQKELVEIEKNSVTGLLKGMYHDFDNDLTGLQALLIETQSSVKDENTKNELSELHNRIHAINAVYESLYKDDNVEFVHLGNYIKKISGGALAKFPLQINLGLYIEEEIRIQKKISQRIGMLVSEFITNSAKHAFKKTVKPKIDIKLSTENDFIYLKLADNGNGVDINELLESENSFGVELIKMIILELGAKTVWNGDNGLTLTLKLKKS